MAVNAIGSLGSMLSNEFSIGKTNENDKNSLNFSDFLKNEINKVNDLQLQSQSINEDFAAGRTDNIHEVMIASEKADLALQFTMQIRNKIIDAYNEIMRMQI